MGEKFPEISPASTSDTVPLVDHNPLTINHLRSRIASKHQPFAIFNPG